MSNTKKPKNRLEYYKILWNISEAGPIIRRYFAMNFFDGVLTALGIVLAGFAFFLTDQGKQTNGYLFFSGLTTAIAIGISGMTGSHLAESAERSLNVIQMKQVLGLMDSNGKSIGGVSDQPKYSEKDIQMALGKFEELPKIPRSKKTPRGHLIPAIPHQESLLEEEQRKWKKHRESKEDKTMFEQAQDFAGKIAAFVDGFSPFAGVMIVVMPFIFGDQSASATLASYIISFAFSIIVLFLLGTYLAILSRDNIWKFGLQMVLAAIFTGILTVLFNFLLNSNFKN